MKINLQKNLKETIRTVIVALVVVVGASYVMAWTGPTQTPPGGNVSLALVPSGAVMAFNLTTCPTGWTSYSAANGRAVIGTGTAKDASNVTVPGGTNHTKGQIGGEEKHTQTVDEMANHSHSITPNLAAYFGRYYVGNHGSSNTNLMDGGAGGASIGSAGGSQPANVMDPYIALTYCVKS